MGESLGYHGLGLGALTKQVLGFEPPKNRKVTMSNWEARTLSAKQVCAPQQPQLWDRWHARLGDAPWAAAVCGSGPCWPSLQGCRSIAAGRPLLLPSPLQIQYAALDALLTGHIFRGLRLWHASPSACTLCRQLLGAVSLH